MPKVACLYHFFTPDSVVSSVLFGDLAVHLAEEGWSVTAYPSNRDCKQMVQKYSSCEQWKNVEIRRMWRPNLPQNAGIGRVFNAVWMTIAWMLLGINPTVRPDVVIIGTDPIMGMLSAVVWRVFKPQVKIVHWCFDMYPEAAAAYGYVSDKSWLYRCLQKLAKISYRSFDHIVDIGSCMQERLSLYHVEVHRSTIVPWALAESEEVSKVDESERFKLYQRSKLALIYAGSLGLAHTHQDVLEIARALKKDEVSLAFSSSNIEVVRNSLNNQDTNIYLADPVPLERLSSRLSSADIHVVTLKPDWTGLVVPSKFFAALAMGRPVLFCGSKESALARWINEFNVGWVVEPNQIEDVVMKLREFSNTPSAVHQMFAHCKQVYDENFSRKISLRKWDKLLRQEVEM